MEKSDIQKQAKIKMKVYCWECKHYNQTYTFDYYDPCTLIQKCNCDEIESIKLPTGGNWLFAPSSYETKSPEYINANNDCKCFENKCINRKMKKTIDIGE